MRGLSFFVGLVLLVFLTAAVCSAEIGVVFNDEEPAAAGAEVDVLQSIVGEPILEAKFETIDRVDSLGGITEVRPREATVTVYWSSNRYLVAFSLVAKSTSFLHDEVLAFATKINRKFVFQGSISERFVGVFPIKGEIEFLGGVLDEIRLTADWDNRSHIEGVSKKWEFTEHADPTDLGPNLQGELRPHYHLEIRPPQPPSSDGPSGTSPNPSPPAEPPTETLPNPPVLDDLPPPVLVTPEERRYYEHEQTV